MLFAPDFVFLPPFFGCVCVIFGKPWAAFFDTKPKTCALFPKKTNGKPEVLPSGSPF